MTESTPSIIVESDPAAVRIHGLMDKVRQGDQLKVAQQPNSGADDPWEIQTMDGHRIAGAKWPADATLLVTATTPDNPGQQAVQIGDIKGKFATDGGPA